MLIQLQKSSPERLSDAPGCSYGSGFFVLDRLCGHATAVPVFFGGDAHHLFENTGEIALVLEAAEVCNVDEADLLVKEQYLALFDPHPVDVVGQALADFFLKDAAQIRLA